jgi:hypothetical protein
MWHEIHVPSRGGGEIVRAERGRTTRMRLKRLSALLGLPRRKVWWKDAEISMMRRQLVVMHRQRQRQQRRARR